MTSAEKQKEEARKRYLANQPKCWSCGKLIPDIKSEYMSWTRASKRKFCNPQCVQNYSWGVERTARLSKINTFEEVRQNTIAEVKKRFPKNWGNIIRKNARYVYFHEAKRGLACERCGYNKHIEICHIKEVAKASDDTLVGVLNDKDNLLGLCRNCHWEQDNPTPSVAIQEKEKELQFLLEAV